MNTQAVFEAVYQQKKHGIPARKAVVFLVWILGIGLFCIPGSRAFGDSIFATYPPGCATVPDVHTTLYGENAVKFFERRLALVNARKTTEKQDAIVAAYRVACADANRSIIWLSFSIPPELDGSTLYQMPRITFLLNDGWRPYVSLTREPGGVPVTEPIPQIIGSTEEYSAESEKPRTWVYILDLDPVSAYWDRPISPEEYNGRFKLQIYDSGNPINKKILEVSVPSTVETLSPNIDMPLNGRLSGNWVMDGADDQGVMLAVSELVTGSIPAPGEIATSSLLMFLSWYTFDIEGKPIWLTGAAEFLPGESAVTLPLHLVSQGQFLGQVGGQRILAGSVNLRALNCGQIDFDFDLSGIGLGFGKKKLQRLFSLEISGYGCSDLSMLQGAGP